MHNLENSPFYTFNFVISVAKISMFFEQCNLVY